MTKLSQKRIDSIYEKKKHLYKVEEHDYKSGHKIELWKKNIKKGFYNCIKNLENNNLETIKLAIAENELDKDR